MSGAEICGTGLAATWAGPRSVSGSRRGSHRMMTGWFRRSIHDSHRCHFSRSVTNRRSLHPPWKRSTYISTTSASLPVWAPSPSALDGGTYVFARPVAWHQDAQILSQTSMADGQSIVELPSSAFGEVKRYLTSVKFTIWFVLCCIYTEWKNILYPYMRTYIHTNIHTYIQTYIHTYLRTYIHTYKHTNIHTYIPTYVHTYIHTNIQTYKHTYIHTYRHTYIYIYIYTQPRSSGIVYSQQGTRENIQQTFWIRWAKVRRRTLPQLRPKADLDGDIWEMFIGHGIPGNHDEIMILIYFNM